MEQCRARIIATESTEGTEATEYSLSVTDNINNDSYR